MSSKITRLNSIEVANNAPLPFEMKRVNLLRVEDPESFWNYDPVRGAIPKLLLAGAPLFDRAGGSPLPPGDDEESILSVGRACKSGAVQAQANMAVARAIVEWRIASEARGVRINPPPEPYRLSVDVIDFACPTAIIVGSQLYVVSFDPRSSLTLTGVGREVVTSILWHTARLGNLRDAEVAVFRTPLTGRGERTAVLEPLNGEPRYSLDQLDSMINETYRVWEMILLERRAARSDGSAASGGLFG